MSLAGTMWKTNLRWSMTTMLGQQRGRIFCLFLNPFPILGQMWLLTTGPLIGITVLFAEFPDDRTAGVSSSI